MRRPKLPRPSLGTLAAAFLVVVGVGAVAIALACDALDEWAPNIATEAFAIAFAIIVVERIVRREQRKRLAPRIDSVTRSLRWAFDQFAHALAVDYAGTHAHAYRPIERDVLAFLDQWLAEKDAQDVCRVPLRERPSDELPLVLHAGNELGQSLQRSRESDLDVLDAIDPELVRAIDDYLWRGVGHGRLMYGIALVRVDSERADSYRHAEETVVRAARDFGEVLARHDPRGRVTFDDQTVRAMEEHSGHARRGGEAILARAEELAAYRRATAGDE